MRRRRGPRRDKEGASKDLRSGLNGWRRGGGGGYAITDLSPIQPDVKGRITSAGDHTDRNSFRPLHPLLHPPFWPLRAVVLRQLLPQFPVLLDCTQAGP